MDKVKAASLTLNAIGGLVLGTFLLLSSTGHLSYIFRATLKFGFDLGEQSQLSQGRTQLNYDKNGIELN